VAGEPLHISELLGRLQAASVSLPGRGTDANVMIGGFIAGANTKVIVRALGPTLTQFGVQGALVDPVLALADANGNIIASNDNWQSTQAAQIQAAGYAPPNAAEAAIIATPAAGNSTAIVSGKNGTTGVALLEVYQLP
jgi:pyridoxal/pyridoxine/pyridoxamine kinase